MPRILTAALALAFLGLPSLMSTQTFAQQPDPAAAARQFIADREQRIRPLERAVNLAWWDANISGKDEDYKAKEAAQNRLDAALADASRFASLKQIRQSLHTAGAKSDPLLARQIDLLYLQYLEKQLDPELLKAISAASNAAEQSFNTYRAKVNGQELAASAVKKVLKESKDSAYRQAVWEASKAVGPRVEKQLRELVKLRNQAARKLGFNDYYDMQLQLSELSKPQVLKLFDELHEQMREPFRAAKAEIDAMLAKQYGIAVADLRPWHYHDPFFQEAPAAYDINLDAFYKDANIARLAQAFYAGIGMDVSDILARSDLYEKPGKCPHAFCTDMDREGDVRVLCNIVPDEDWMGTTLHELGHAVYDKYIDRSLPYVARSAAHSFTTEGVAMLMERFAKRGDWMKSMGLSVQDPQAINRLAERIQRDKLLIFAAWSQVMVRFEMSMYENPDQDLNKLWWDLIEKYQLIARPAGRNAPDYAAKIHVVSSPCYYHSYMMGEMFAAQLHRAICRDVLKTDPRTAQYTGRKDVGQYMVEKVFAPGSRMKWDEFVPFATGEALSPKALIESLR